MTNISTHGLWVLLDTHELFLSFDVFPWFREAPIGKVLRVQRPSPNHLYWPDLDIDLAVESIEHPERFPLVSEARPNYALHRAGRRTARNPLLGPNTRPRNRGHVRDKRRAAK